MNPCPTFLLSGGWWPVQCTFALTDQVGDKVSFPLFESFPVFHCWVFLESSQSRVLVLLFYSCFDVLVYKRVFLFYCFDNL